MKKRVLLAEGTTLECYSDQWLSGSNDRAFERLHAQKCNPRGLVEQNTCLASGEGDVRSLAYNPKLTILPYTNACFSHL